MKIILTNCPKARNPERTSGGAGQKQKQKAAGGWFAEKVGSLSKCLSQESALLTLLLLRIIKTSSAKLPSFRESPGADCFTNISFKTKLCSFPSAVRFVCLGFVSSDVPSSKSAWGELSTSACWVRVCCCVSGSSWEQEFLTSFGGWWLWPREADLERKDAANQLDFVSEPVSLTSEEGSCCSGTLSQGRELS